MYAWQVGPLWRICRRRAPADELRRRRVHDRGWLMVVFDLQASW